MNMFSVFLRNNICHSPLRSAHSLSFLRNISSRIAETIYIEKPSEAPIIVIQEDDNVDIIGPPDPVSNLRPIVRRHVINETALQQRLREMQGETQTWNHNFWKKHNTNFMKERQEYINSYLMKNNEKQHPTADDMSEFYKKFLDENWETHVKYNFEWYKKNFTLLFLSLGVSIERFFYKF